MDALDPYLDSLANLGTASERGTFTVARQEIWARLRSILSHGESAPRHFLRWLHARGAETIRILSSRDSLTITAGLSQAVPVESLDYSGLDIDLARALVGAELVASAESTLQLDDAVQRNATSLDPTSWRGLETSGRTQACLKLDGCSSLLPRWIQGLSTSFRHSPIAIFCNDTLLSGPYSFPFPVLAWRHLRRSSKSVHSPLVIQAPSEALETFQAARWDHTDVVLGLIQGWCSGPTFGLVRLGEHLPLTGKAVGELAGLGGVLVSERFSTDLGGDLIAETSELTAILASLRDEAVDMALQLYQRRVPLTPEQADAGFLGLQSVLLHLLGEQRFTEGHLLAEWMGPSLERGRILEQFRYGYTFDRLRSLLAEPAGHPQTALRWHKRAEGRLRDANSRDRSEAEEALLISARLELRARRDHPRGLSGDLHGKLLQLANQLKARGHHERAASVFLLLGSSFRPTVPERLEHLLEASRCCPQPPYSTALAEERRARGEGSPAG